MKKNPLPQVKNFPFLLRLAGTVLSLLLLIWLIAHQNWHMVLDKAAGVPIWAGVLMAIVFILSYGLNALRWSFLLWAQEVKVSFWQAYRLHWCGSFISNFLPSTIGGDGFRMLAVYRYAGSKTISIGSVILDRILNMAAMVCLIPVPLTMFGVSLFSLGRHTIGVNFHSGILQMPGKPDHIFQDGHVLLALIPIKLKNLFNKYFPSVSSAFGAWSSRPLAFAYAFLAAWPSNLLPMAATYLIARQLGMNVTFWQVISVQTVTYFLTVLPISINGYGLREVTYTTLYTALGSTLEQASTLALLTRLLIILSTLPGAIWLSSAAAGMAGIPKNFDD